SSLPAFQRRPGTMALLRDRDGALWIGTRDEGLLHVHQGRTDVFGRYDGLSSDTVDRLFEDREGNIWIATPEGIDRFRSLAAATTLTSTGRTRVEALTGGKDSGIWASTESALERWNEGHVTFYRPAHEKSAAKLSSGMAQSATVNEIVVKGLPDHSAGS